MLYYFMLYYIILYYIILYYIILYYIILYIHFVALLETLGRFSCAEKKALSLFFRLCLQACIFVCRPVYLKSKSYLFGSTRRNEQRSRTKTACTYTLNTCIVEVIKKHQNILIFSPWRNSP